MKQYGLNIKKNLKKIVISRVFTVYQLAHFLKYELPKIINDYRINIVIIPDLLAMFLQQAEMNVEEVKFLVSEIIDILEVIAREGKVLLIISLFFEGNRIVKILNKCITIDKNKTNDKFKMLIQQRQGAHYVITKKCLSLTAEDVL